VPHIRFPASGSASIEPRDGALGRFEGLPARRGVTDRAIPPDDPDSGAGIAGFPPAKRPFAGRIEGQNGAPFEKEIGPRRSREAREPFDESRARGGIERDHPVRES
jgi:hypothetical protein